MDRLSKVLASRGVASRRRCEELIAEGRVRVNGRVVTEQGTRIDAERDTVEVDGRPVGPVRRRYVLLNKPVGYISTARDPRGRRTVLDLVPSTNRLYPVGRLDLTSEGLLLLTNDGALAERLTHPRYEHEREYWVLVEGRPSRVVLDRLRSGIDLEDGRTWPAAVTRLAQRTVENGLRLPRRSGKGAKGTWLRVVIHEGRKRQVRRMCEAIGHPVKRLVRMRMGPLHLKKLRSGEWRELTEEEVRGLRAEVGLGEARD